MSFLIGGYIAAVSVEVEELEGGQRWLLGGGLGVGRLCLWIYAMLYRSEDANRLIMPRWLRVEMKLVVAIILVVSPETHNELNATQSVCTVMGLSLWVTLWVTVGGFLKGARVRESWKDRHPPRETRTNGDV